MKQFRSTLLMCVLALPVLGQQSRPQNESAALPARGLSDAKEHSQRKLSLAAPQAKATHVAATPRATTQSVYQGTWSSAVTYSQSQSALYSGAIYYSLVNNNLGNNPATSPASWSFLAPGGSQSPCGAATIFGPCVLTVNDLPNIPSSQVTGLANVATTGSYADLSNKPALGTAASQDVSAFDAAGAAASVTLSGLGGVTASQAAAAAPVQSVAGKTGAISLSASDIVGLGTAATQNASAFDPAGAAAAITLSGLGGVTSSQAAAAAASAVAGIPAATSTTNGLLSKTDWAAFNGKQNALGFSPLNPANNLSDIGSTAAARTNLGLGSAAMQSASAFDPAGAAAAITLSGLGGVTSSQAAAAAPVQSVAGRTGAISLTATDITGLGSAATQNTTAFDAAGAAASAVAGIPAASSTSNGLLSKTDWAAFNGKQNALGYSPLNPANNLSDIGSTATARTNLGLGSAATQNTTAFDAAGAAASAVAGIPAASSTSNGLLSKTDWAAFNGKQNALGYSPLNPANNLSDIGSTAAARTNLGLGSAATQNATAFDPAGAAAAITLSGLGGVTASQASAAAPVQSVAGRSGAITLSAADVSGLGTAATQSASAFSLGAGRVSNTFCVGTGGVTANHLIKFDSNGCAVAATAGTFKGIALGTVAATGTVEVGRVGIASCSFENATTINNLAIQGTTDPTSCRDSGFVTESSLSSTIGVVGGIHNAVLAGNTANVRLHGAGSYGTQGTSGNYTASIAGATSRQVSNKVSDDASLLDFPAVPDGSTDNTAALTSAWNYLSGNSGMALHVPCFTSTNHTYNFQFKSAFSNYVFPSSTLYGDNGQSCGLSFQPGSGITSAPGTIFDWRGSNSVSLHDLRMYAAHNYTNPTYDPATLLWIGRSATATDGGSNTFDRVHLESTATGATLYETNSENFRLLNSSIFNSAPGTGRAWYLSNKDDLGLCTSNCYTTAGASMLSVFAYGDVIVSSGGNLAMEYKANNGTGDYSFLAGYGYTNSTAGTFLQIDAGEGSSVNNSENSIFDMQDYRIETSKNFLRLAKNSTNNGSIAYLLLRGDTFANNAGVFVNGDSGVTLNKAYISSVNTYGSPSSVYAFTNGWWYNQDSTVTFTNSVTNSVLIGVPGHGFVLPGTEDSNLLINTSPYQTGYLGMTPPGTLTLRAAGAGTTTAHGPSLNVPNGSCFTGGWPNQSNGDICMASSSGLYMYDSTGRLNKFLQSSRATFADLQDHNVYSALNFQTLPLPSAPSILTASGTGSNSYQYQVLAMGADGAHSAVSALSSTVTLSNPLATGNCISVNMPGTVGASYYKVYRTLNGTNQGAVNSTFYASANPFVDCGATADGTTPQTFATATSISGLNSLAVGTITATGTFSSSGSAPSVSVGAGAGSGGTASVATGSTANRGQFTVVSGATPTASAVLATVNYSTTANPLFCVINPASAAAAALSGASQPYVSTTGSTSSFAVSTNSVAPASGTYTWTYHCY